MKHISVVGAGTMGNGIAHVFALYGCEVTIIDISQERLESAYEMISANLDRQIRKET